LKLKLFQKGAAFGGLAEPLVTQLGNDELHLLDQQRARLRLSLHDQAGGALGKQHRLERLDVVGQRLVGAGHESNSSTDRGTCDHRS
jgi:hypothetical protein